MYQWSYKQLQFSLASVRDKGTKHQAGLFAQRYNHLRNKNNLHPVKLVKDINAQLTFTKAFERR